MTPALQAIIDTAPPAKSAVGWPLAARRSRQSVTLSLYHDMSAVEAEWRRFEADADCTVFQTFDWLASWQRHIGARGGVNPAIVVGRRENGKVLMVLPLAIERRGPLRRLAWLGSDLCDYNAPLIATDFSQALTPADFVVLWSEIRALVQSRLACDFIDLEKMPETIGGQKNLMLTLPVTPNRSHAHLANLSGSWDLFYADRRSPATRQRDRTKRRRLAACGELQFVTARGRDDIERTLDTLIAQKAKSFARMGVANMFERAGCRDFLLELATGPQASGFTHISRLDVGLTAAAVNFGLMFRGSYYHFLASYDAGELSRFGPGAAHLHDLLRFAIEHGFKRFDFTIGDEAYKRDWSDTEIKLYDHVSAATPRGVMIVVPLVLMRRLMRIIKQTPVLWDAARKARGVFGWLLRGGPR